MSKVFNVSFLHAKGKNQIRDGLMYRKKKLKKNQGMLFHTGLKVSSFWMKNTFIPLDVLFLNKKGKIIGYKEKNKPHSLKAISIGKRSFYVLEMNAGWVKKNKVKVGDKIKIRKRRKTRRKRGGMTKEEEEEKALEKYIIALGELRIKYDELSNDEGFKEEAKALETSYQKLMEAITGEGPREEEEGSESYTRKEGGGKHRKKTRKKRGGVKSAAPKKPTVRQRESWKKIHDKNFKPKKYKSTNEMIMMGVNRRLQQQDEEKVANILLNIKKEGGKRRRKTRKKRGGNDVCTICQGQLPGVSTRNNSSTFTLKDCTHKYHKVCLIQWISTSIRNNNAQTCPVCRTPIRTNDFPEGINTEVRRGTFNTNDGFNMNTLIVIGSSIDYASGHGVLSPLIGESTPRERDLYFQLIRTVVQLGTGDVPFTAQNVYNIYRSIRTQYDEPNNGHPSPRTNFYDAINGDIGRLGGWLENA
jgi:uncharacterized membrane protein (UPF0127 family)/rubrerythrin